jgi:hypothetical protein
MTKTRIAILATLSNLHRQPIRYDLAELSRIVTRVQPDLLGVEIERDDFERDDLARAPVEVREALIPLARHSDIVVVPIGAGLEEELRAPRQGWLLGLRAALIHWLDGVLTQMQIWANGAREVNSAIVSHACGLICHLEEHTCGEGGRRAWQAANRKMLENIVAMAQRDPQARILVALQCRRKHWLEPKLRRLPDIELVNYWEL